jgi:hypothetical protein
LEGRGVFHFFLRVKHKPDQVSSKALIL